MTTQTVGVVNRSVGPASDAKATSEDDDLHYHR